ncbi:ATP-dependent helicase [Chamaesiphon sp.]|uniref:ATP-dependent helicase n=1 Tax=Chamaesiphon sp. TaxID=2814140 RepID=UPI0035935A82
MPTLPAAPNPIARPQAEIIAQWRQGLRQGQRTLADWQSGQLAVSAVPGAGKSYSMAVAAAIAIAREQLHQRHQLIIVTLTRSAAANIKDKIRACLKELGLPPIGYGVNTIHSLALSIATKHPDLSRLDLTDRTLVMPTVNHKLIEDTVQNWLSQNPHSYRCLLEGASFDGEETERLRRQSVLRTEILPSLAFTAVREAKSSGLSPADLWEIAKLYPDRYDILSISAGLYQAYQELLVDRNYLDYDEMIAGALRVMADPAARRLWQQQVHAVFEDEAQDSSPLQEKLLRQLAGIPNHPELPPNLIRVGDPNQAINSTFTPADPRYFRDFCQECSEIVAPDLSSRLEKMEQAGRSNQRIMDVANFVLNWGNNWLKPPAKEGESTERSEAESVFWQQTIRPVAANDPQPNPLPQDGGVELHQPSDVYASVLAIEQRLTTLFAANPTANAAILVRENRQAKFIYDRLSDWKRSHPEIELYEAGESDRTSKIPGEILTLLQFITRPHSPEYLKAALKVLLARKLIEAQDLDALSILPERFLYPSILETPQPQTVQRAREICCELIQSRLTLPDYQLISYLASRLNYQSSELATADKLADKIALQTYGRSSIHSAIEVLQETIATEGFENIDDGSESRYTAVGQVTIITMHKAKGLDWDYVFIPFLSDRIPGQLWTPQGAKFLGDFTLAEVARAKIRAHLHQHDLPTAQGAWELANYLKQGEDLRLLYVAITRAKKLLWLAAELEAPFLWNRFNWQQGDRLQESKPSPLFTALRLQFPQLVSK